MTNADIIFVEAQKLAKAGKIDYTGKVFKAVDADGKEIEVKETEQIHTYNAWKQLGYQVRKGEKAIAKFTIWKYAEKKAETDDGKEEKTESRMFMKNSAFFSRKQVDEIEVRAV